MSEIFVIDDDVEMLHVMQVLLERAGYGVTASQNARQMYTHLEKLTPDMFVVDMMMPEVSGIELVEQLRANPVTAQTPIILMTGRNATDGVIEALEKGADDYLVKPVPPRELTARIRAHLRRSQSHASDLATIRMNDGSSSVNINGRHVELTPMEFDLLRYLCEPAGRLRSSRELLMNVWRYPGGIGDAALVRNHIHNLRVKLEDNLEHPLVIQSRHGRGYLVRAQVYVEPSVLQN